MQLDLTNAYHQMRIKEGNEYKTVFRTRYGHFEYQGMPFGLSNALASFQSYIDKILTKKLDIFIIVYLDDILIYIEHLSQGHVDAVQWVPELLRNNGLFTNLKKCRFYHDEVRFLGYVVSAQRIRIKDEKIEAVRNWSELKSIQDIQVFIGFANFYQQFIQEFSRILVPLISILKMTELSDSAPKKLWANDNKVVGGGCDDKNLPKSQKSKNAKSEI